MAFHDKLGRFAGGFADFLTGNRFDFDGLGKGGKAQNMDLLEKDDDDKEKEKTFLDTFLEGYSYNPEKNKTESDKFLDKMASRGFGSGRGGSFAQLGDNLAMFTPDNTLRNQALLEQINRL